MLVAPLAFRAPRWAYRLAPSPSEPRPGAAHYRPEVRTTRPPRPWTRSQTARLRAFGTALRDSPLRSVPKHRRLAAPKGKRPSAAKASGPAQDPGTEPGGKQPRAQTKIRSVRDCHEGPADATVLVPASLGVCLAYGFRHNGVLYSVSPQHRHPLTQDPRCRVPAAFIANVLLPPAQHSRTFSGPRPNIISVVSCRLSRLARITAITGPFPPGRWQCSRQPLRHPSRQPLTSLS